MRIIRQIIPFTVSTQIFNYAKPWYFSLALQVVLVLLAVAAGASTFSHWHQPGNPCLVYPVLEQAEAVMYHSDSIPLMEVRVVMAALEEYWIIQQAAPEVVVALAVRQKFLRQTLEVPAEVVADNFPFWSFSYSVR